MYLDAPGIVHMGGAFPALGRMRMNVAGCTIFIGGSFHYRFVTQEDEQGCNKHSGQEQPSARFISFPSHNQRG
jgi:hypothetical protein